jgi:hypothetical protein
MKLTGEPQYAIHATRPDGVTVEAYRGGLDHAAPVAIALGLAGVRYTSPQSSCPAFLAQRCVLIATALTELANDLAAATGGNRASFFDVLSFHRPATANDADNAGHGEVR